MTSKFDIHVFGDGLGETIFIEFENNKIGIVDFGYRNFLKWFDEYITKKKINNIEFILWTHPHDDHTHYFVEFIDYLLEKKININNFFRFPYNRFKNLSELIDCTQEQLRDVLNFSPYNYVKKTQPQTLLLLCEKLSYLTKQKIIKNYSNIHLGMELFPNDEIQNNISIYCIAPTQNDIEEYLDYIDKTIRKEINIEEICIHSEKHNLISTAICISFGKYNILLGGDVEKKTWNNVFLNDIYSKYTKGCISFLKAPHHGSENAFSKNIWSKWGKDYNIVITPFNRYRIPKPETINNILPISKNIYILKNRTENSVFNDNSWIKTFCKEMELITLAEKATHHIKFEIYESGDVIPKWLKDN